MLFVNCKRIIAFENICFFLVWIFNEQFTKDLILNETSANFGVSILDIALYTRAKVFISHVAVQICMKDKWKSGLKYSYLKLLFAVFFPFCAITDIRKSYMNKKSFYSKNIHLVNKKTELGFDSPSLNQSADDTFQSDKPNTTSENYVLLSGSTNGNMKDRMPRDSDVNGIETFPYENGVKLTNDWNISPKLSNENGNLSTINCFKILYSTPAVKFSLHFLFFVSFLLFYSWFLVRKCREVPLSSSEHFIFILNSCYFLEAFVLLLRVFSVMREKLEVYGIFQL